MSIKLCGLWLMCLFCSANFSTAATAQTHSGTIHPTAKSVYSEVLMWHDVVPGPKDVWFDVTADEFEKQMAQIKKNKLSVITLEKLLELLTKGTPLPPRPVVLTFDDTTEGLYQYAYPVLKRYGFPATYFIHTDYVGVRTVKDHCTWEQLAEMQASGLISIQSHTRTHPADLRKLADKSLTKELVESKLIIEKRMKKPVFAFAYTEGNHDARVRKAVQAAGYSIAIDENWGSAGSSRDMFQVHRYSIHKRWEQAIRDLVRAYKK